MFDILGIFALLGLGRSRIRQTDIILSQTGRESHLLLVPVEFILLEMCELAVAITSIPMT